MAFTTITDEELVGMGVTGLSDTPGLSTEAMQEQFDEYPAFLKDKFKTHINEIEAETAASNIGAVVPDNVTADGNVQSILDGLREYVDNTVVAIGTSDMATAVYDPNRDGVIAPAQGGTGQTTLQAARNAMGLGNTLDALPIANGGTGQTTAAGVRNALGLGNTTDALPVANGGTGKASITSGKVLVGNGTNAPTERSIDNTTGGTYNSDALITSGAVYAAKVALSEDINSIIPQLTTEPFISIEPVYQESPQDFFNRVYTAIKDYISPNSKIEFGGRIFHFAERYVRESSVSPKDYTVFSCLTTEAYYASSSIIQQVNARYYIFFDAITPSNSNFFGNDETITYNNNGSTFSEPPTRHFSSKSWISDTLRFYL